ncbi:MAG TPA: VOC family protein [Pseudomonadales bacterium]|nr:VOC family protein [Pseudomonadales bacterium]
MLKLDHIQYSVPDLAQGVDAITARLGIQPVTGGIHPGNGTRNALLSLGDGKYFEVIAPDPAQALAGTMGGEIRDENVSRIRGWVVNTDDLDSVQHTAESLGLTTRRVSMSRNTPAGPTLNWELMFVDGHGFDHLFPVFIDWLESPHPSATTLQGGTFTSFTVSTSEPDRFAEIMNAFDIGEVEIVEGPNGLAMEITNASGDTCTLQGGPGRPDADL